MSCHNAVERAIAAIERYRKSPAKGTIALEYIDRRYIWGQPLPAAIFINRASAPMNASCSPCARRCWRAGFTQIHSYSAATSIAQEDFARGTLCAKPEAFVFVDHQDQGDQFPDVAGDGQRHVRLHLSG